MKPTLSNLSELEGNYREATGDAYVSVELIGNVVWNSNIFVGIVFFWINFLLEAVRFWSNKSVKTAPNI